MLRGAGAQPPIIQAGHGDEPVEAQAFIAAGHGVTVAHELNVLIEPDRIAVRAVRDRAPVRLIQPAIMREQRAPAPRAVLDALREVGGRRARRRSTQCGDTRVGRETAVNSRGDHRAGR